MGAWLWGRPRSRCCARSTRRARMDDALAADLASTALATARRFHAGATMWCVAPALGAARPARRGRVRAPGDRRQARAAGGRAHRARPRRHRPHLGPARRPRARRRRSGRPGRPLDHAAGPGLGRHDDLDRQRPPARRGCRRPRAVARRPRPARARHRPLRAALPPAVGAHPRLLRAPRPARPSPTSAPTRSASPAPTRAGSARWSGPGRVRTAAGVEDVDDAAGRPGAARRPPARARGHRDRGRGRAPRR